MKAVITTVAGISHQLRDFADPPNIFDAVIRREPEIGIQAMADVVAIENVGVHSRTKSSRSSACAMVDFPEPERPVSQTTAPRCPFWAARVCAVISPSLQKMFLLFNRSAIGVNAAENNSAAADHAIIDDNKTAQRRNAIMVIQDEWRARLNGQAADLVARDCVGLGRTIRSSDEESMTSSIETIWHFSSWVARRTV